VLQRAHSALPGNTDILEKGEELAILRIKHQLKVAEKRAAADGTASANELVEQIRSNLVRLELEITDARSQRYPEDAGLKHKVGLCLKRMGNYREAALRFQESRNDEQLYVPATLELGECLQHLRQFVKALHCYQRAAEKSAEAPESAEIHQLALYRAGVLATGLKEWETAERHLQELAAQDPDYKDVRKRLDKLREIRDKG
jgi:tetratricopeptide (TPR) repeat protein